MPTSLPTLRRARSMLAPAVLFMLTACGGGTSPTPAPTGPPDPAACPASGSLPLSIDSGAATQTLRRVLATSANATEFVPGQLAITYAPSRTSVERIDSEVSAFSGARVADFTYPDRGFNVHVINVDPPATGAAMAKLSAVPGVTGVVQVRYVRRMSITANDPYYVGIGAAQNAPPFFETATIPGQWDMHVLNLGGAWSQISSTPPVIGASIAVIDTGVDVTHPELATPSGVTPPKIVRTQCFVTFPTSGAQSTGPFVTDTDGHGTDVAGIADSDTNNSFAFASVAFDAPLLAYRIFPTDPPGGCDVKNPPAQCDASSVDEASAIDDAVAHGAKVINLSLGSVPSQTPLIPCTTTDPEYISVENAISHGVVIVAASGNGDSSHVGQNYLDCPAADPGVIAVGASALNDTNAQSIFEYVASYSNFLLTNGTDNGGAYVVAPGGDAGPNETCGTCTVDFLHWINNIYSTTGLAIDSGPSCSGGTDKAGETNNCNVLMTGTSMATAHVSGIVSLMLAKNPNLTPAQIAAGLCASADDIGDSKEGCGRVNAAAAVQWAATH